MEPFIEMRGVTKRFGTREVLSAVDFSVNPHETVALLGPSGSGKSTLLRCINVLNTWDAGTIRVGTHELQPGSANPRSIVRQVRMQAGMIFQDFGLFPHLTVLDNILAAPVYVRKQSRAAATVVAMRWLDRVGLADRAGAYPEQLSGGQKQRVAIARALCMEPQALLCDEITSALDPELKHEVLEVLGDLRRDGMTLVVVTHEIEFARRAADRVLVLADGNIIEQGTPSEVLDHPRSDRTRQFLSKVLA